MTKIWISSKVNKEWVKKRCISINLYFKFISKKARHVYKCRQLDLNKPSIEDIASIKDPDTTLTEVGVQRSITARRASIKR